MTKTLRACIITALLLCFTAQIPAVDFTFLGVRTYTVFGFLPAPTGADFIIGFEGPELAPNLPSSIEVTVGGGYQYDEVYRTQDGGNLSSISSFDQVGVDRVEAFVEPGFVQRLSPVLPVDLYLATRVYYRENLPSEATVFNTTSYFTDEVRILETSIRTGAKYLSADAKRPHGDKSGIDAGVMIELAPGFLGNRIIGGADYLRANATLRWYRPMLDIAPGRELNLFNIYIAQQASVDWLTGATIPIHAQERTGGFFEDNGLGGIVRGFEKGEKPALFKSVLNSEVRFVGPAILKESIFPILVGFVDVGYFAGFRSGGYFAAPTDASDEVSAGFVASAGGTISINLMGITYLGFTVATPLLTSDAGLRADRKNLYTGLAVGLQF